MARRRRFQPDVADRHVMWLFICTATIRTQQLKQVCRPALVCLRFEVMTQFREPEDKYLQRTLERPRQCWTLLRCVHLIGIRW
jgi:hypothetical protein